MPRVHRAALLGAIFTASLASACGGTGPTATGASGPSPTAGPSILTTDVVVSGLDSPVDVTPAWDDSGRIFVVEQDGRIRIVKDGTLVERPFLDITARVAAGGERGLLGLAFHPDYPADPRFFVDYTDIDGDTVIASFAVSDDADVADPDSEVLILAIDQPFANHNGGAVVFGPDEMLYVGMGDGGSGGDPQGNGQRMDTLLGKVLRVDVGAPGAAEPYVVPPDNPFVGVAGAQPEIWHLGMRNPWRMRFDRTTGDLWIGDVGQGKWEEIDVARAGVGGLNYGWNVMEGFHCYKPSDGCDQAGLTLPVAEYSHDFGCAVIGGVVVRDPRQPAMDGRYVFGDSCSDNLWLLDPARDGRQEPVLAAQTGRGLSAINDGGDGTVYATDLGRGELIRITGGGGG
jgi:glucose/arabinose dehydrogenase